MKVKKENLLVVKCEEGCQERRPYNRQSLPWGFPFCRSPEKCVLTDRLANDVLNLTTPRQSSRKNQKFSGVFRVVSDLEPEVTESGEFYVVNDEN